MKAETDAYALRCWSQSQQVVRCVYLWFTLNGMAGPLPPLPKRVVKREQLLRDLEAHY